MKKFARLDLKSVSQLIPMSRDRDMDVVDGNQD
jgi:hypothetical protein